MRHAVQPEAPVKLLWNAGRQLRPGFFGFTIYAALLFGPRGRPGARRRLRRR
jgi:hypothetical protein